MAEKITRIHGRVRFIHRRDTAEKWKTANPVLAAGEHGVVTDSTIPHEREKIGDGTTPWNELGWWHGPKGENGRDAVTDISYNPQSENAQSGKAVAEAVGNKQDKFADVSSEEFNTTLVFQLGDALGNLQDICLVFGSNGLIYKEDRGEVLPIYTGTPTADDHAANKGYVDNLVKNSGGGGGSIVVDRTYNPQSENAQSGKAVAEAIASKQDKIATIEGDGTLDFTDSPRVRLPFAEIQDIETNKAAILEDPEDDTDAVNKAYVDDAINGIPISQAKPLTNGLSPNLEPGLYVAKGALSYVSGFAGSSPLYSILVQTDQLGIGEDTGIYYIHVARFQPSNLGMRKYDAYITIIGQGYYLDCKKYRNIAEYRATATEVDGVFTELSWEDVTVDKDYVDTAVGDIESALDAIIAIQEQLIGGAV